MEYGIGKVLISREELKKRVLELGAEISEKYKGKKLICICMLKGAVTFFSDLTRAIGPEVDVRFDSLTASSYGSSTESSGNVNIKSDLSNDIRGEHVLIVEDILDTGITLSKLCPMLLKREPASLEICVLLNKAERRRVEVDAKYIGFTIPDEFVIGYGLDYAERFRNLPDICVAVPLES